MDLSKIPEPSEGELAAMASFLEPREDYYGPISCVLAHILRHGRVLAKSAKAKVIPDDHIDGEREAVKFFEQYAPCRVCVPASNYRAGGLVRRVATGTAAGETGG